MDVLTINGAISELKKIKDIYGNLPLLMTSEQSQEALSPIKGCVVINIHDNKGNCKCAIFFD